MTADELRTLVSEWEGGWIARKDPVTGVLCWSNEDNDRLIALAPLLATLLADAMEHMGRKTVSPHPPLEVEADLLARFAALGETA